MLVYRDIATVVFTQHPAQVELSSNSPWFSQAAIPHRKVRSYRKNRGFAQSPKARRVRCSSLVVSPVHNRFQAIATHPKGGIERLIRVHAKSLALARKLRECDVAAPACRELDAGQCRIIINDLRREIDRLRRGIDPNPPFWIATRRQPREPQSITSSEPAARALEFTQRASGKSIRKSYAAPALGDRAAIGQLFGFNSQPAQTPSSHLRKAAGNVIDLLA